MIDDLVTFGLLSIIDPRRGERLNVGLVAWLPDGHAIVRIVADPARLQALHPRLKSFDSAAEERAMQATLDRLEGRAMQEHWLRHPPWGPRLADKKLGTWALRRGETIEQRIQSAIARLVQWPSS